MFQVAFKVLITAVLVVAVAEISKRDTLLGGLIASIPLVSTLAMIWLYLDTKDVEKVSQLSQSIFWMVIPSLVLFVVLPVLLRWNLHFYLSLFLSSVVMVGAYWLMLFLKR